MRYLIFILPFLFSCKTVGRHNNVADIMYIEKDTVVLTTEHINYNGKCSEDTTIVTCVIDTLYFNSKRK